MHPVEFKPMTSWLWGACATTAALTLETLILTVCHGTQLQHFISIQCKHAKTLCFRSSHFFTKRFVFDWKVIRIVFNFSFSWQNNSMSFDFVSSFSLSLSFSLSHTHTYTHTQNSTLSLTMCHSLFSLNSILYSIQSHTSSLNAVNTLTLRHALSYSLYLSLAHSHYPSVFLPPSFKRASPDRVNNVTSDALPPF